MGARRVRQTSTTSEARDAALGQAAAGLPDLSTTCARAEEFGGTELERAAFCFLQEYGPEGERRFVSARNLADRAIRADPQSFRAHYVMGVVQHQGEGNLPKSLYHLERAEQLFIARYGERPSLVDTPWTVFHRTLLELVYVHGEMDHHEDKIRYVDLIRERLGLDYAALKAWPLLKLKRFDEARFFANEAINSELDPWVRAVGLTALCAVESEQRNRQAAYEACRRAAEPVMDTNEGVIELSNAAAAASEVFRFDEAERLYLESTKRVVEGSVNPWGRLTRLYLRQGRFAEALSAWREMREYRNRRPKYLDQQDQSDAELIGAAVLILAGRTKDALPITARTVHRPDRQGTSSAQAEQNEAGAAIIDRVVKLDVARQLEEEAVISPFGAAMKLRAQALQLRFEAWTAGRRAAEVLADEERLTSSLRPECPGSIELPEWLDAEVVHVVGPGVALAAIAKARAEETLPRAQADLIFRALEAEAFLAKGDDAEALDAAVWVVENLPPSEALLRARAAAIGARAAIELGDEARAMAMLGLVMATDPGVIRRLGHTLPVTIVPVDDDADVREAVDLLEDVPLFEAVDWGFELRVGTGLAVLVLADGTEVARVRLPVGAGGAPGPHASADAPKDESPLPRRISKAVLRDLLVPNVDITQADIRSLDGSLGSGGRASERAKSVLDEVLDAPPR
ncbi:tetratricopeptide repeat protein [Myxococcota bacterium]|nr:tetratricopeptide repeat protein [Myxococcota bacterium]